MKANRSFEMYSIDIIESTNVTIWITYASSNRHSLAKWNGSPFSTSVDVLSGFGHKLLCHLWSCCNLSEEERVSCSVFIVFVCVHTRVFFSCCCTGVSLPHNAIDRYVINAFPGYASMFLLPRYSQNGLSRYSQNGLSNYVSNREHAYS